MTNILVLHNSRGVVAQAAGIYLFKVNNENARIVCEICSELTINTTERRQ